RDVPPAATPELTDVRESVRAILEEVRAVATRLRPEALDDLGLPNALEALCRRVAQQSGLTVRRAIDADLPPLSADAELVIYRIAQEALANPLRHSGAAHAELALAADGAGRVTLIARDDGSGLGAASPGAGIQGMHERALLLDGACTVRSLAEG